MSRIRHDPLMIIYSEDWNFSLGMAKLKIKTQYSNSQVTTIHAKGSGAQQLKVHKNPEYHRCDFYGLQTLKTTQWLLRRQEHHYYGHYAWKRCLYKQLASMLWNHAKKSWKSFIKYLLQAHVHNYVFQIVLPMQNHYTSRRLQMISIVHELSYIWLNS